jgi:hypothetical protein
MAEKDNKAAVAEGKKQEDGSQNTNGDKLIEKALAAFGIDPQYVHSSRYDDVTKEAIIVTVGGKKVRFMNGDDPNKLDEVSITGVNPVKRKPITGKGK